MSGKYLGKHSEPCKTLSLEIALFPLWSMAFIFSDKKMFTMAPKLRFSVVVQGIIFYRAFRRNLDGR